MRQELDLNNLQTVRGCRLAVLFNREMIASSDFLVCYVNITMSHVSSAIRRVVPPAQLQFHIVS
jgi:hypothetical protein